MGFRYHAAFVALATPELERLVIFYRSFLGQPPVTFIPQQYAEFHLLQLRLALFNPKTEHRTEFVAPAGAALSICLEVEQLETAIAHLTSTYILLQEQGLWHDTVPLGELLTPSHGREIYAYDPDGNRLILYEAASTNRAEPTHD
ncbi:MULTISPECIES: hypothetical protein [unclassified Leptolyngbya]|uniref:hypothetical protein n=1 Tax=unclassified Leptolyngbya TaxID=2650499 RepID=UPI001683ACFA|nr:MULTISPECIES: hypothetical protein [unclassified Leptolyngbya]MBD1913570.1 hypothetical protein [Leptolyngbya sp. FACHB-8]MBD2155859.1 hypothetical protein [Leptolyngbya sp. FACHB-16]